MLTTRQAAERLGVSLQTVRRWAREGLLDGRQTKDRGEIQVTEESVERAASTPPRKSKTKETDA